MFLNGHNSTEKELAAMRRLLKEVVPEEKPLLFTVHEVKDPKKEMLKRFLGELLDTGEDPD